MAYMECPKEAVKLDHLLIPYEMKMYLVVQQADLIE